MFQKFFHFIKYNNAVVIIIAVVLILGGSVFASETVRDALGEEETRVEGIDNSVLLATDLANFNMDYKIEKIEADADYYYITYTYLDLDKLNNAWQYQIKESTRKISKKSGVDVGTYMAEELKEEYQSRIADLTKEQAQAKDEGEIKRVEITEYNGLIGKTLDIAGAVFPGYESVKKVQIPSPDLANMPAPPVAALNPDNLTEVYTEYISQNDPDSDNVFGAADNCPLIANQDQSDTDKNGIGDVCEVQNNSVTIEGDTNSSASSSPAETGNDTPVEQVTPEGTDAGAQLEPSAETVTAENNVEVIEPAP